MVRAVTGVMMGKGALALGLVLGLSACELGTPSGGLAVQPGDEVTATRGGRRVIERDVEAPQVFHREEPGLWDGRPSLGGVWVAHPDVRDPERVVIRNSQTGARVVGALFRRERENPGPRFQISSEAATALGILPGAPTPVAVTAMRLQQVEVGESDAPAQEAGETAAQTDTAAATATATATAPVPAASAQPAPGSPAPQTTAPRAAAPETIAPETVAIAPEPAPPRRRGLFSRAPRPEASEIAITALDAPASVPDSAPVTAQVAAAEPRRGLFRRRAAPSPDTTLIPLPEDIAPLSAPVAAPASALDRPFTQIGIFSVEANARNAQAQMQRAGLPAEIRRGQSQGQPFWRVVVGPAATAADRQSLLTRVRGLGFGDAYFVVR